MLLLSGDGEQVYHKRHLVPFGEYFPFRRLIGFLDDYIDIPMSDMTPGPPRQPQMRVRGIPLGLSICYEDVFSRDVNRDLPAAKLLINTSNDAWFGDSLAPHQHLQIARMRAMETGRPLMRSSNTGPTAFIDARGEIRGAATALFELAVIEGEILPRGGKTPFLGFAKVQPWLAGLVLLFLFLLSLRSVRRP
jgi:apolipoprotein N-acyltransferase